MDKPTIIELGWESARVCNLVVLASLGNPFSDKKTVAIFRTSIRNGSLFVGATIQVRPL